MKFKDRYKDHDFFLQQLMEKHCDLRFPCIKACERDYSIKWFDSIHLLALHPALMFSIFSPQGWLFLANTGQCLSPGK